MERFTVDHLLRICRPTWVVPMHVSPDGALLTLTVQQPAHTGGPYHNGFDPNRVPLLMAGSRVWVVDTRTGEMIEPFPAGSISWGGRWSPDGTQLAAYVQHGDGTCVGIWSPGTHEVRLLREAPVWAFFGFEIPQWTPNGRSLLAKLRPAVPHGDPTDRAHLRASVEVYSSEPGVEYDPVSPRAMAERRGVGDLGRVDVSTGAVERLATALLFCRWRIAPDGRSVALLRQVGRDEARGQNYCDLVRVSLEGAETKVLADHIPQNLGLTFSWSEDSRSLAYAAVERGQRGRINVVPADGSTPPRLISGEEDIRVGDYGLLRWSADSRFIYCFLGSDIWELAADGATHRRIRPVFEAAEAERRVQSWVQRPLQGTLWARHGALLAITGKSGTDGCPWLACVELQDGKATLLRPWMPTETSNGYAMEVTPDGSSCFLMTESPERAFELWRVTEEFRVATPLRPLNSEFERVAFGRRLLVSWRDKRGQQRQAALLLPPGYTEGRRVPLIINVYGGDDNSGALDQFGFGGYNFDNADLLAAHGYAVLHPDMPMEDHAPLRQLPSLVRAAVHRVVDLGIADPARLGVIGHSYGGYCVLALLTQSRLFRAAVCSAGIVELTSFYSEFWNGQNFRWAWAERGQGRMGGTPWEKREAYIRNSPFFLLDRVAAPVLLVSGTDVEEDARQAKEAFGALRRLDRTVELRLYQGEGHNLSTWSADSVRDLASRVLKWFEKYL